jgi:hypothetical protein
VLSRGRAGFWVWLPSAFIAGEGYALSSPYEYQQDLGSELADRAQESIVSILQTPEVAICLAGPLGAWIARGRRGEKFGLHASWDLVAADEALSKYHGVTVTAKNRNSFREFSLGLKLAMQILGDNWGAVMHVVEWLKEHNRASGLLVHKCLLHSKQIPEIGAKNV